MNVFKGHGTTYVTDLASHSLIERWSTTKSAFVSDAVTSIHLIRELSHPPNGDIDVELALWDNKVIIITICTC